MSGGGKSISYGDLVKNQQLKLTIPVKGDLTSIFGLTIEGNPPMKPVSDYTVIGKSVQEFHHQFESGCERNLGNRCAPPEHVARARGSSEDARIDARLGRSTQTKPSFRIRKSS